MKTGRNDPCPCGSGKKYKRCCQGRDEASAGYTQEDRATAFGKLELYIEARYAEERARATAELWSEDLDRVEELGPQFEQASRDAEDLWFAFDRPLPDGSLVVDRFLAQGWLTPGERAFLVGLRDSAVRLYEVTETVPGVSLTLRERPGGAEVTVHEQAGSRTIPRFSWLAARVVPRGASGRPELEAGLLPIPDLIRPSVLEQHVKALEAFRRDDPGADEFLFHKGSAPFFHDAWRSSILDPPIPELRNTDDEPLLGTRVTFDVADPPAVCAALADGEGIEPAGDGAWTWSGANCQGKPVTLGGIELKDNRLVLETNSAERGARGLALLEKLAGPALRHRSTTHEDLARQLRENLRAARLGQQPARPPPEELPPEIADPLTLDHLARYYRAWLDESIPALDGATPREAARRPALRPRLVELLHDLEGHYQQALLAGHPAYDPSWMWAELGLDEGRAASHPPPLAHERLARAVPGFGSLCRDVAEELRRAPGFDDASTLVSDETFRTHLAIRRFLREPPPAGPDGAPPPPPAVLETWLRLLLDVELHRRKCFWVDESLAFLLANTELDLVGRELRPPFPAFALVFTDRHTLGMGERLLARERTSPLAGHLLRVLTVYVAEETAGNDRRLRVTFAFDAGGADLPALVRHQLPVAAEEPVQAYVDAVAPRVLADPALDALDPLRGLLTATLNAVLYATSAGVRPEVRLPPAPRPSKPAPAPRAAVSSESVWFLPGAIEITQVRRLQELQRTGEGRELVRRFMVRGHWRRPAASWHEQRPRWIRPYWKGPDLAAIIERTYRLKP